jgi:hypothetical protein
MAEGVTRHSLADSPLPSPRRSQLAERPFRADDVAPLSHSGPSSPRRRKDSLPASRARPKGSFARFGIPVLPHAPLHDPARLPARPRAVGHRQFGEHVVDDIDHVCSARTSVHLATMETGHRDFIRAMIPRLLSGDDRYERPDVPTIVSPFVMAIVDLAVLREVLTRANG